jgi:GH25 family lysozyme M1 (1,4-beta-N-acetylmuramidase)
MVKKNSKTIRKIFIAIGGVIFLYLFILLVTPKQGMPADIKATIDSLTTVNKQLIKHQKQIDSTIAVYEEEVNQINNQVDNIKEKTTIIREYYHEVGQQVNQYTPTQVDSFFKAKYGY